MREKLGGLATAITALVAVVTVVVAGIALKFSRDSQRETTAKDIYRDYLKLAFDNPTFANPGAYGKPDALNQDEKYRWFVAFVLNSCDEIVRSKPTDGTWRKVILEDIKFHLEYLKSPEFAEEGGWFLYSRELRSIYEVAIIGGVSPGNLGMKERVMGLLDVRGASDEQKEKILEYAADVRKFEIGLFWQRSLFFWGFIGAAFVAYGVLINDSDKDLALAVSCFGLICSIAWTLQNRGSKYWQEAWEQKVESVEYDVLKARLFSNIEPLENKGWWGAARFSVSKLAIVLSDFTVLIWLILLWKTSPSQAQVMAALPSSTGSVLVLLTAIFVVALFAWGRSTK